MFEKLQKEFKKIYIHNEKKRFEKPSINYYISIEEIEKDAIKCINELLSNENFKEKIFELIKKENIQETKNYEQNIEKIKNNLKMIEKEIYEKKSNNFLEEIKKEKKNAKLRINFYEDKIEILKDLNKNLQRENIYEYIVDIYEKNILYKKLKQEIKIFDERDFLKAYIFRSLYNEYLENEEPYYQINNNNNNLEKTYNFICEDEQYKKYGLLKLDNNRQLYEITLNSWPNYIHDKRCGYIILDKKIPNEVLLKLNYLKDKKLIKDLSLRVDYYQEIQKNAFFCAAEERAFGKYFSFEGLEKIILTRLYSENMDSLWIDVDKENITFEEILDDFNVLEEDTVVTQVIHCEYFKEENQFFINHLDHEYIFYSWEEFQKRKEKKQKGNKYKRVKTFKIDNSRIPFILETGENILLFFLSQYFECQDLLLEYFQKVEKHKE